MSNLSSADAKLAAAAKAEGLQAFKAGDHSRAASLFLRALDLGGEVHTLRSNRAAALSALGDHAAALADADAQVRLQTGGKPGRRLPQSYRTITSRLSNLQLELTCLS